MVSYVLHSSACIKVEDIKIKKSQYINLENVHFVGLYCITVLQCTVQKHKIPLGGEVSCTL